MLAQYDQASEAVKELIQEPEKEKIQRLKNEVLAVDKADYSGVYEALAQIPADLTIYTEESLNALNKARSEIQWDKKAVEQTEVDKYADAIRNAVKNLQEDKYKKAAKELNERIMVADAIVTVENQEELKKLINDYDTADEVTKGYILQMNVIKLDAIRSGIEALNLADYSAVEAALKKIPSDLSIYTAESVAALNAAKDAVIYGKDKSEQALVDSWAKNIEKAISELKKRPEVKPENPENTEIENPTESVDKQTSEKKETSVATGDTNHFTSYITLMCGMLGIILLTNKRKNKDN